MDILHNTGVSPSFMAIQFSINWYSHLTTTMMFNSLHMSLLLFSLATTSTVYAASYSSDRIFNDLSSRQLKAASRESTLRRRNDGYVLRNEAEMVYAEGE
jgi:hypothetical protein